VERGAENLIPRPHHLHHANTAKEIDPTTKNLIYSTGGRIASPQSKANKVIGGAGEQRSCLAGAPGSLTAPTVVSERRGFERAVDSVKWSPCFIVFVQDQIYSISS